jgi:hypothetical protein
MPEDLKYLTVVEAATMLRTSTTALISQRYRGSAPGSLGVRVDKRLLFRLSDLDRWFDEQHQQSEAV